MLEKILQCGQCVLDTHSKSKKAVLEKLSQLLSQGLDHINSHDILQGLTEREKLGSTAIGHGVALPHARLKQINTPIAAFIKLSHAIDFDADEPVDLIFALIVPTDIQDVHLQILANIANIFNHEQFRIDLRRLTEPQAVYDAIIQLDSEVNTGG